MILSKHPDLMNDQELSDWVDRLVTRKNPESIFLDYKEILSISSRSDKREIAKDVSSFANERGGVILYGIPEERQNDEPVPVDVSQIGMEPVSGLSQVIEDTLVGALTPRLPELRIREVPLMNPPSKVVYLVWHPESWEAPHMIHAYGEHRYYKRGNFRAVLMEEGEVERLYLRRQTRRALADEFLDKADFGEEFLPWETPLIRFVVCPAFPFENRVDFSHETMRQWLQINSPGGRLGWQPFIEGVRHRVIEAGFQEFTAERRLFSNGAVSFFSDVITVERNIISGLGFLRSLNRFLQLVGKFYKQVNMSGEVLIDITLLNMEEVRLTFDIGGLSLDCDLDYRWHSAELRFRVAASAVDTLTDKGRWSLEQQIMDRLTQCFGVWSVPEYFREDGSPV